MNNTKAILQERADALEKELKGLREEIARMPDDEWMPKHGEAYWFLDSVGRICEDHNWTGKNTDQSRLAFNNVFKTKEEAEERRDALKKMNWGEFPETNTACERLHLGVWTGCIKGWINSEWQQAMYRMGTLRAKK